MSPRSRRGVRMAAALVVAALASGVCLGGCTTEEEDVRSVVREYAAAWSDDDPEALGELTGSPERARERTAELRRQLGAWDTAVRPRGQVDCGLGGCDQEYRVTHQVPGVGAWTYDTTIRLRKRAGAWRVRWSSANFHPRLEDGDALRVVPPAREAPRSATLLTVDEQPLADASRVPSPIRRMAARGATVERVRPSEESETLFRPERSTERIGLTLSPAVQRAAESALAGDEGDGAGGTGEGDEDGGSGDTGEGDGGRAEDRSGDSGSIVALRASTGEVLAAVGDEAFDGRYDVGSAFRVISAAALIERGLDTSERVSCPKRATAGGEEFRNPGGERRSEAPFWQAFASGCDTTIAARADDLRAGDLSEMAGRFGLGRSWEMAVPTYAGRVPAPQGERADRAANGDRATGDGDGGPGAAARSRIAASAIGRDGVRASPLAMAGVAATVSAGRSHDPYLIVGENPGSGAPLPDGVLTRVRGLMRAGVTLGPAGQLDTPEKNVHVVLGGVADQPERWLVGYRGELAFAIRTRGDPIAVAERFLDRYP